MGYLVHYLRQDPDRSPLAVCGLDINDDRHQPFGWSRSTKGVSDGLSLHPLNCPGCIAGLTEEERHP